MIISRNTPKEVVLKLGEACEDCNSTHHCCRHDAGFLAEDDLKKISRLIGISEKELKEKFLQEKTIFNTQALKPKTRKSAGKPYGPCIFLDEKKGCGIQEAKPLQCRLYTCKGYGFELMQWFYLNYLVNPSDPQSLREYADFLRFNEPIPGGRLQELVPDKKKLDKIMSYELLKEEKE